MTQRVTAWECIGRGRIEGAQPYVGICQDRRMEFVYAFDYDEAIAQLALMRQRTQALVALVRQLACMTSRDRKWERNYRVLQARAERALEALANDE